MDKLKLCSVRKIILFLGLFFFCLNLSAQSNFPVSENEESQNNSSKIQLGFLRISEGFTQQSSFSGVNLSTMLTWSPSYILNSRWHIQGFVGATQMNSNKGNFIATRVMLGVSVNDIFENTNRWVPEVLVGVENWHLDEGGSFSAINPNIHFRPQFQQKWLSAIDSIYLGYVQLFDAPHSAYQVVAGMKFNFSNQSSEIEK